MVEKAFSYDGEVEKRRRRIKGWKDWLIIALMITMMCIALYGIFGLNQAALDPCSACEALADGMTCNVIAPLNPYFN